MPETPAAQVTHSMLRPVTRDEIKPHQRYWLSVGYSAEQWDFPERFEEILTHDPAIMPLKGHRGSYDALCYHHVHAQSAAAQFIGLHILEQSVRLPNHRLWTHK